MQLVSGLVVWTVAAGAIACSKSEPTSSSAATAASGSAPAATIASGSSEVAERPAGPAPSQVEPGPPPDAANAVAGPAAPPIDAGPSPEELAEREREQQRRREMEQEAAKFADLLTSDDSDRPGTGDMSKRQPGSDLGAQIDAVRESGKNVKISGGGTARTGMGGGPKIDGPGTGSASAGPTGRITVASKTAVDSTTLTADAVLAKIQSAYMAGLKRCYKNGLKLDVTMRGKLTLSFTVDETGRTKSPNARGFNREVDDCIVGLASSWRFPVPKDTDGEVTDAGFSFQFQMVPD